MSILFSQTKKVSSILSSEKPLNEKRVYNLNSKQEVIANTKHNLSIIENYFAPLLSWDLGSKPLWGLLVQAEGPLMKRSGSVGKITKIYTKKCYQENIDDCKAMSVKRGRNWYSDYYSLDISFDNSYYLYMNSKILSDFRVVIDFGNGKKTDTSILNVAITDIPQIVQYKESKPQPIHKKSIIDRFGNEMAIGDLVVYVNNYGSLNIGNIRRFSKTNVIYCTRVKFSENDPNPEDRIKDNNRDIFKLTEDIREEIMILKLQF